MVSLRGVELSEQTASVQASARSPAPANKPPTEMAAAAKDAATWLANAWIGAKETPGWSAFYAARFNEVITKNFATPYWRTPEAAWDRTGIAYPDVLPFSGTVNPAYDDPLRQPTDCRFSTFNRIYTTPPYPSMGNDKSPGWAGALDGVLFKDTWHATRLLAFSIPTTQRTNTRRPIIMHVTATIHCAATIRGTTTWFALGTKAQVINSGWSPGSKDLPITHYNPKWRFTGILPDSSPGGWVHDETIEAWRYGSWKTLDDQPNSREIILIEIGTPPSLGRYYARNDAVTVLHDDTATVWWPQGPGEMP